MVLLVAMGIMVAITLSASARSNHQAGGFLVARTLVANKLSQVQAAGYTALNGPDLGQSGAGIVDGTPKTPTRLENAQGAASATFEFTQSNQLSQYFSGTSTSAPRGSIYMAPYLPSKRTVGGNDTYPLVRVTAEVRWKDSTGLAHSHSETTLIPRSPL